MAAHRVRVVDAHGPERPDRAVDACQSAAPAVRGLCLPAMLGVVLGVVFSAPGPAAPAREQRWMATAILAGSNLALALPFVL